jgi:hypothetical protein
MELYRQAIRKKVCEHCEDWSEKGSCTLTSEHRCSVDVFLDKIVEVVHAVHSRMMADYVNKLRSEVCMHCQNQERSGACRLRQEVECGLDRYAELVVEAIEEVDTSQAA